MKRALLVGVGMLIFPTSALSQSLPPGKVEETRQTELDPDAPSPNVHLIDEVEPKRPLTPPARDLLGSHLLIGAAASPSWSLGKLGSDLSASRGLGTGFGGRLDAGLGISRAVSIGVWGSFAAYTDGNRCTSCGGKAFGVGPFMRYHLSQGLRFNPWVSLGAGYRRLSFEDASGSRQKFSGLEWLRLELGADYYAFSGFAVGPYGTLGLSSYSQRPAQAGSASVNVELSVGLRLMLDLPGR